MIWFFILGCVVVYIVGLASFVARQNRKIDEAREGYSKILAKYGTIEGQKRCPHEFTQFGQTGVPGVTTMTTKWCRICGAYLGPATLKRSIFGNYWE